jgi:diguanylate cyclase (GGDEF)-like protein/PAS domain S-box-containing protein
MLSFTESKSAQPMHTVKPSNEDFTITPKIAFLNSVFIFAGITSLGLGIYRWQSSQLMGTICFAFALYNFAFLFYLRRHKQRIEIIASTTLLLSYIVFTSIYLLAPDNTVRISLFFLLLSSAIFLKGKGAGLAWLILILATILSGHILPGFDTGYSHLEIITDSLYLIALFFIIRKYEIFHENIHQRDQEQNLLRLSEERFRTMIESGSDVICIISNSGLVRFISPSVASVLGFSPDEVINKHINELIHPDELSKADANLTHALTHSGEAQNKYEFRMKHKEGGYRDIEIVGRNLISNPMVGGIVLSGRDITGRKQAEARLLLTAKVFANTLEGIIITDVSGDIIEINDALIRITGYSREELIGHNPRILRSDLQSDSFYESMWSSITTTGHWAGEIWNCNKNGELYAEWLTISAIKDTEGKVSHYVGICSDITLLKQHEKQLERIAHYDSLTGIPNRTLLNDRMKQATARTAREQNMMAVCYLDLDGFKPINDSLGHEAGDHVLIEIAKRIENTIRGGDTVARLGGDEFVILLLGLERGDECSATLERLLEAISEPIEIMNVSFSLSASIGVSIYPLDDEDTDTLLRHADQAMYTAKQSGKNRSHIYDPAMDQRARNQQKLFKNIQLALNEGQFELYYQPKVDLRTQRLVGVEALIRWNHPELGLLPPAKFLPPIENTDLDIAIGEWVITTALHQLDVWCAAGLDIEVSINISAHHLESDNFIERLKQQLARHTKQTAKHLEIEVLETVALGDIGKVSQIIEECKKMGLCFALDDFGTGYSSLSYLSSLPIDTLKIDQSFMRDLTMGKRDHAIVLGIVALSKAFELKTVAEGIETGAHFNILLDMGCDIGQGYGIALPMPAAKLTDWASKNSKGKLSLLPHQ